MDGILREGPSIVILPSINHRDCHSTRCAGIEIFRDCIVACHSCEVLTGTDEQARQLECTNHLLRYFQVRWMESVPSLRTSASPGHHVRVTLAAGLETT